MIGPLIASFTAHLVSGGILFVALFLLFGFFLSGRQLPSFLRGMLGVAASMVYSPFVFLRRATGAVLTYERRGEADYAHSEHYLMNKLLLWWHAIVIVVAMAWLSISVVLTWSVLLPPSEVREALHAQREQLANEQQQLVTTTAEVTRYDDEWTQRKVEAGRAYRLPRERTVREARTDNERIEVEVQASGNTLAVNDLAELKRYTATQETERASSVRRQLEQWLDSQYYLDDANKSKLREWVVGWEHAAFASAELAAMNDAALRASIQPAYEATVTKKGELERKIPETEGQIAGLEVEARLRWKAALITLVMSLLQFLFAVWVVGLLTEALGLMIRLADHVRALRQTLAPEASERPPAPAEPRLPLFRHAADGAATAATVS